MSTTYKFSTFQQLFDHVPTDRISDCMAELAHLFVQMKATAESAIEFAKLKGIDVSEITGVGVELPAEIEWEDDGLGVITGTMVNAETGEDVLTFTTRPKPQIPIDGSPQGVQGSRAE